MMSIPSQGQYHPNTGSSRNLPTIPNPIVAALGAAGLGTRPSKLRKQNSKRDPINLINGSTTVVLDEKQKKTKATLVQWARNQYVWRLVSLSRAFYTWRYKFPAGQDDLFPLEHSEVASDGIKKTGSYNHSDQKHSYLQLFTENEKLREQLLEIKKATLIADRSVRATAVKNLLSVILRSQSASKKRYYFDIWHQNAKVYSIVNFNLGREVELKVGLQRIESEKNYVRNLEEANHQLKLTLALTIYFYKWKSKSILSTLANDRVIHEQQKKLIFAELLRMRAQVSKANQQEVSLLRQARSEGAVVVDQVRKVDENLKNVIPREQVAANAAR